MKAGDSSRLFFGIQARASLLIRLLEKPRVIAEYSSRVISEFLFRIASIKKKSIYKKGEFLINQTKSEYLYSIFIRKSFLA